ncbi:hypothetical protein D1007_42235 [Hordeum vulgare]|nr:hypothetical protein D1007_42235 [Hordeum vulgare]
MTRDSTDIHRMTTQNTTSPPPAAAASWVSMTTLAMALLLAFLLPIDDSCVLCYPWRLERAHGRGESGVCETNRRFAYTKAKRNCDLCSCNNGIWDSGLSSDDDHVA